MNNYPNINGIVNYQEQMNYLLNRINDMSNEYEFKVSNAKNEMESILMKWKKIWIYEKWNRRKIWI